MAVAPEQQNSLEQFLALPEEEPALEFADGVVTPKVLPKARHSVLQRYLTVRLDEACRRSGLADTFTELRCTFAGSSLVPDITVYRRERVPTGEDGEILDDFTLPPDIAVEIASPRQSVNALVRRCLWYVANGVEIALLVDPDDQSVLVFRPDQPAIGCRAADAIDLAAVVPGFELTAQELFAALRLT